MKPVIKQAVFCTAVSLSLWGMSSLAAVTFVGNDIVTGSAWRTPGVIKPNDIDGDNVYGSAGYFLPSGQQFGYRNPLLVATNVITSDPKGINAMPAYITDLEFTNSEVGSSWGGEFSDCGNLDTVPGSIGLTGAGIMPSLAGTNSLDLKLKRSNSPAFRLTLIFGNNPNPETFFEVNAIQENTSIANNAGIPNNDDPLGMNVTLNDGSGPISQLSGNPSLSTNTAGYTTYQSWDIPAGSSDIDITVDLTGTTNTVPRLSGLAFDSLPVTKPTVLIQPVGGTYFVGNPISLSVNAGGTGIGYQWLENSNIIAGANGDIFTITNAVTTNSGNYQVLITNSVGSVTSMVAAVTVLAPPVTVIYQDSMGGTAAALNGRIPDTVGTSPWTAASVWNTDGTEATAPSTGLAFLPFTPQAGRIYTLSADIEDFDTTGNNWTALGFANGNLVNGQWHTVGNNPVGWFLARGDNTTVNQAFIGPNTQQGQAFNYTPTTMTHYQVIFDATPSSPANWTFTYLANGTIYVPATKFGGSGPTITTVGFGVQGPATGYVKNFTLSQQVPFSAPFITLQPVGGTHFVGETAVLGVQVGGSDPLTFQWQKNSNNIPNATNLDLTLSNLQTSDSGSYRVLITNPLGNTNSVGASIIVITPVVSTIYHDTFSYVTNDLNGSLPDTAGQNTWIADSTWSSDGTEAVANSAASANAFLPFVPQAGYVYTLSANIDCTGGNWLALGFADASSTGFDWQGSPNNPVGWCLARPDSFLLDNQVFVGPGTAGGTDTGFAPTGGTHNYAVIFDTRPASPSAWTFTFQMDSNTLVGPEAFGGSGPSISDVGLGAYSISQGDVNNFILTEASASPTAPVVLTQPIGGTFLIGSQASLSGYAGGTGPLTYQWQKNSNNIAGANSPQLTLANLALTDTGYYRLVVSNALSSVSSSNALIIVASSIPVVSTTFDTNADPNGGVYPSIPVNTGANNLILNNLASVNPPASGNNFTGVYMRNGTTGTNTENSVINPANVMNAGTYDFIFDTSLNTSGYNISAVVTYSGWVDRAGQDHTVYYRQVGSTNFVLLASVLDPSPGNGSLREAITNSAGGILVSGVNAIRVVVNTTYYVYREIEVDGTPTAITAGTPSLAIKLQTGSALLSWPAAATGYSLTGSSALGAGALWQSVGGTPTVVNGTNQVTISITNSAQFFRLVK